MGTGQKSRYKDRRERLWRKSNRCRKCGAVTFLPGLAAAIAGVPNDGKLMRNLPPDLRDRVATIQHKVDRFHPDRLRHRSGEIRYTLWCWKCNDGDAKARMAECVEKQKEKSRHGQKP